MHKVKKSKERNNSLKREKFEQSINYSIYIVIALAIITALGFMISSLVNISNIINCILLIGLNYFVITALNNQTKEVKKTEYEIIQELNNDPDCIEKFQELKYILGIRDTYDRVYTLEGAEYLTWVANGYFHVFLNMIYYNTVFMSIKSSDVKYYKTDYNSCDVKLKDKTLEFRKEADIVFRKILPNKDYNWIKSSQNK
jgi:Mn2+/Fe2+ NRAMP family transporter